QLARSAGAYVIGTGGANGRQTALDLGVHKYIDLEKENLVDIGGVDLVCDIFGGDIATQSAALIRNGGKLITIAGPSDARPVNGTTIAFVVEANPAQLKEVVQRFRAGKLKTNIGQVVNLDNAIAALSEQSKGKTIIRIHS